MSKQEETAIGKYLTRRNATVLFLVAASVLVGQTLIQILVAKSYDGTHAIDAAAHLQTISDVVAKDAYVIARSSEPSRIAAAKDEMGAAVIDWYSLHGILHTYVNGMWFVDLRKADIVDTESKADASMDPIVAAARRMLSSPTDTSDRTRLSDELNATYDGQKAYSDQIEQVISGLQVENDDWIFAIRVAQLAFVTLVLMILLVQWRYMMRPAVSQVNGSVLELEKLGTAVENASDHIIITDAAGTIVYANAAAERITGFSKKEMIGKKAGSKELWGGLMDKAFYETLWKTISVDKKVFKGRIRNRRKDGSEYDAEVGLSPILGPDGKPKYFVGIERDITKEVQVDRAKTEFVSMAAHQLRTPIATTRWYLEMLMDGDVGKLKPKQKDYLAEVGGANDRMGDIVDDFLNVSRIELGTFEIDSKPIPFSATIRESAEDLKPDIEAKRLKVSYDLPDKSFVWNADKGLLVMVVGNLISNAVKYTPDGGRIAVKAAADKARRKIAISVADTGIGIPTNQQVMIFSKMFRADNAKGTRVKGTGLGLYIVKSVVEAAGGSIAFVSTEGKGTTFTVELPLSGMRSKEGTKRLS